MSMLHAQATRLRKLLERARSNLVADMPLEIELCECDCAEKTCLTGKWENCERRLKHVAGEKARRNIP